MPSTELADEVSGVMLGEATPRGKWLASVVSFSLTSCRLRYKSLSSPKTTVTIDKPGIDWLRMLATPTVPNMADSMWRVTKDSTSSAENPGASV